MQKYFFFIITVGTIVMVYVMKTTGASLKTSGTPQGIINLEFAYNSNKATAVINAWGADDKVDNIEAAKINTYFDFIFIFFYSLFLYLGCNSLSKSFSNFFKSVGILLAKAAIVAGLFDLFENAGMLITLNGHVNNTVCFFTVFFSVLKWTLILLAIMYILIAVVALLVKKIKL